MPDPDAPRRRRSRWRGGAPPSLAAALVAVAAFLVGRYTAMEVPSSSRGVPRHTKELPPSVEGAAVVIDGDTMEVQRIRVRLFGIDAPERDQLCLRGDSTRYACGQVAREELAKRVSGQLVRCSRRDTDVYGRMVAVCKVGDSDLAAALVEDGVAIAYRHYSSDYIDEEERAHLALRGLWQGSFEQPSTYRQRERGGKN